MPSNISHQGIVQSIDGHTAIVKLTVEGCSSCGKKSACGIGKLAGSSKTHLLRVPATGHEQVGDNITVSMAESELTRAALMGYFIPACSLLLGAILGDVMGGSDQMAALGAFCGLAIGILFNRRNSLAHRGKV